MFGMNTNTIEGTWTGWLCDQDSMKTISKQIDPVGYLERYPKSKASNLNTIFKGFAIYHHGQWFILDKRGSDKVKQLIARSQSTSGFMVTVQGVRNGDKIKVTQVFDKRSIPNQYVMTKETHNRQIRGEFSRMGI
jgi:hypothetical protein